MGGAAREAAGQAEAILADHLIASGVAVVTIDMQLAKPQDRQRRGAPWSPWPNSTCCFCFDPRHFGRASFACEKSSARRTSFLLESVADLRKSLRGLGSEKLAREHRL